MVSLCHLDIFLSFSGLLLVVFTHFISLKIWHLTSQEKNRKKQSEPGCKLGKHEYLFAVAKRWFRPLKRVYRWKWGPSSVFYATNRNSTKAPRNLGWTGTKDFVPACYLSQNPVHVLGTEPSLIITWIVPVNQQRFGFPYVTDSKNSQSVKHLMHNSPLGFLQMEENKLYQQIKKKDNVQ